MRKLFLFVLVAVILATLATAAYPTVTVTATKKSQGALVGGARYVISDLALSSTYVTNGIPITAAKFGLSTLNDVILMDSTVSGYVPQWVRTGKYIKLNKPNGACAVSFGLASITGSATKYLGVTAAEVASAAATPSFVVPAAGSLRALYANVGTAPGSNKTYALTVVKNGSDGALTLSIAGTATAGNDTAAAHAIAVAAGDRICLKSVADDGATAALSASILYEPTGVEAASGVTISGTIRVMAIGY